MAYEYDHWGVLTKTWSLNSGNADARGITTDDTSVWVVDRSDERVYKYDTAMVFQSSFNLDPDNGDPGGITTDGVFIWVVDESDEKVYKYDLAGGRVSAGDFDLDSDNEDPRGISTDGASVLVTDRSDDEVYQYDLLGTSLGTFELAGANKRSEGLTTDGSSIWVVDHDGDDDDGSSDDDDDDRAVFTYTAKGRHKSFLPMDAFVPTGEVLYNYDTNRDNEPGLRIKKTKKGLEETHLKKFQAWTSRLLKNSRRNCPEKGVTEIK